MWTEAIIIIVILKVYAIWRYRKWLKNYFKEWWEQMKVFVACEESQEICKAFRKLGHKAYSCDILPCSGGHQEWHIQDDVLKHLDDGWDLMIAHPTCTYLCVSGAGWYYHPEDKHLPKEQRRPHPKYPNRREDQKKAIDFFMKLANAPIDKICIENPVCIMSSVWRKPDQMIQPYEYGHEASKTTCLWLKNLPKLKPTKIVSPGEFYYPKSGARRRPKWFADSAYLPKEERQKLRSKTFPGIAKAMAEQWGKETTAEYQNILTEVSVNSSHP